MRLRRLRPYPRFTATNQPPKERLPSSTKTRPVIPRLPAWIWPEEVVTPFCLWPLTEQSPFTRNWPGSLFTTVPFGSRQLPVERPVDVILRSHRLQAPVPSNPTMATQPPCKSLCAHSACAAMGSREANTIGNSLISAIPFSLDHHSKPWLNKLATKKQKKDTTCQAPHLAGCA